MLLFRLKRQYFRLGADYVERNNLGCITLRFYTSCIVLWKTCITVQKELNLTVSQLCHIPYQMEQTVESPYFHVCYIQIAFRHSWCYARWSFFSSTTEICIRDGKNQHFVVMEQHLFPYSLFVQFISSFYRMEAHLYR